jgi:hypothetical protein
MKIQNEIKLDCSVQKISIGWEDQEIECWFSVYFYYREKEDEPRKEYKLGVNIADIDRDIETIVEMKKRLVAEWNKQEIFYLIELVFNKGSFYGSDKIAEFFIGCLRAGIDISKEIEFVKSKEIDKCIFANIDKQISGCKRSRAEYNFLSGVYKQRTKDIKIYQAMKKELQKIFK